MKILVIDRDRLASQMIRTKMEGAGHSVIEEAVKNNAVEIMNQENINAVFLDPAPLTNARPVILGIRRSVSYYTYICLMSHSLTQKEAWDMGCNDLIKKPIEPAQLQIKSDNAQRMVDLIGRLADESEDFPSAGGVIAKSAFNQLFLAAIDRADRYGERSNVVFISLKNYKEIRDMDGPYAAEYATSRMAQYLVKLRRQSDIIAQTGRNEYALLLQRPQNEQEPIEAATRFAAALTDYTDLSSGGAAQVELHVGLLDLPAGNLLYSKTVVHQSQQQQFAD